ncbi:MAG TPA: class I SAM-dependent methyltransferase [Cyclobacteriaceae bacterium]
METELVKSCPVCRGTSFRNILTCKDHTFSQEFFTIQECENCQLRLTNPRPDEDSIGKFYQSSAYISHSGKSNNIFDLIYLQARKLALRRKFRLINIYKQQGVILDYGCGTGEFLEYMAIQQWRVLGIEPAENARTKANDLLLKYNGPVKPTLDELSTSKFDVITLWHVLEHIATPDQLLSRLKIRLNKNGYLFVAVPNYKSHDADHYKEHWAGYDVPRHLWHFSQSQMKAIFEAQGFQLLDKVPLKMDSYYVSLLSEKYKNKARHNIISPIKAFIRGMTSNEKAKKSMNYSSLIYIARHG